MSLFDQLVGQAQGLDLGAVAQSVGLSREQVEAGARALLPQIADPNTDNHQAAQQVAAQTGIDASQLTAMVPALLEQARGLGANGGAFQSVLAGLGGQGQQAGAGTLLGSLGGAIDRDGDGNPINDITNLLGGR